MMWEAGADCLCCPALRPAPYFLYFFFVPCASWFLLLLESEGEKMTAILALPRFYPFSDASLQFSLHFYAFSDALLS